MNTLDLVRLTSGGPNMTVMEIKDSIVKCMWFEGNHAHTQEFPHDVLVDARLPRDTPHIYRVDVFTPGSVYLRDGQGRGFPEQSYAAYSPDQVAQIIQDCSRPIAGICKVEVWIGEPPALQRKPVPGFFKP